MLQYLISIANDWATRCFGDEQMRDPLTRAIRLVEEAAELAQSVGVERTAVWEVVSEVYNREPGKPFQEMGGVFMTAFLMAQTLGRRCPHVSYDPITVFVAELRRVLAKSEDPTYFAKRNAEKINLTKFEERVVRDPFETCRLAALRRHAANRVVEYVGVRRVPRYDEDDRVAPVTEIAEGLRGTLDPVLRESGVPGDDGSLLISPGNWPDDGDDPGDWGASDNPAGC